MSKFVQMWIFDPLDFYVKSVIQISDYEIKKDEECNSNSTFYSMEKEIEYKELDLVFIKEDNVLTYSGMINNGEKEKNRTKIICKDILNIFNEKIPIISSVGTSFEYLIKETGIEDFIASQINLNYTAGADYISSRNFIQPVVKTHTPLNISVSTENNIYNLAAFMNNCRQNYDIKYDFILDSENRVLKIEIYKDSSTEERLVDLNQVDQENLKEIYSSNVLAKVTVLTDTDQLSVFLKNDRTTTTDESSEDVIFGKKTTIYTKNYEDAMQEALNQFKSNKYEHYFNWNDTKDYNLREKILIKTTKGDTLESYISAKEESYGDEVKKYTCGKLRVNFIDKFLKEKYS